MKSSYFLSYIKGLFYFIFIVIGFTSISYNSIVTGSLFLVIFYLLVIVIVSGIFFGKQRSIFSPDKLFLAYSLFLLVSLYYAFSTGGENSPFITGQSFYLPYEDLLISAATYLLISYIFFIFGFNLFVTRDLVEIKFDNNISQKLTYIVSLIFLVIGLLSFYLNVVVFSSGNILNYLGDISIRSEQFSQYGSTAGYLFAYTSAYLFIYLCAMGKVSLKFALTVAFISVVLKFSTGRIIGALILFLSYFVVFYFLYFKYFSKRHHIIISLLFLVPVFGILAYVFRVVSSLSNIGELDGSFLNTMMYFFDFELLSYYLIDKGNLPNIFVFLKVIDSWLIEFEPLYGVSLFTPLLSLLPSSFLDYTQFVPSIIVKVNWYSHVSGGNLPVTGFGELYMNFGFYLGALAMFLFGYLSATLFNILVRFGSFWYLVFYANCVLGFIMIYPKGEFDNFSIWFFIPILLTYFLLLFLSKLIIGTQK